MEKTSKFERPEREHLYIANLVQKAYTEAMLWSKEHLDEESEYAYKIFEAKNKLAEIFFKMSSEVKNSWEDSKKKIKIQADHSGVYPVEFFDEDCQVVTKISDFKGFLEGEYFWLTPTIGIEISEYEYYKYFIYKED